MPKPSRAIEVVASPEALGNRAADEFATRCAQALARSGRFSAALSGGSTPRRMLGELARRPLDWRCVHLFFSDERCVPPTDEASNYRMAYDALISKVVIPEENVHRIRGERPPHDAAADYRRQLEAFFGGASTPFDIVFLGLGPDGHTASLFPGAKALDDASGSPVAATTAPPGVPSPGRVSLTYTGIDAGKRIVFLVEGPEKTDVVARVLQGPYTPAVLPAQGVAPRDGTVLWLLDRDAAAALGPAARLAGDSADRRWSTQSNEK